MRFYINFCTNVMSGHVMSGLTLLCADLRFGLSPASPPLQSPFCHSCPLLLDFLLPPFRLKVHSVAISRSFWTSSCLLSASRSNPPLFLAPFGLPRASPPLQIQSSALSRSFWTSSHLPATSKSNPQLFRSPPRKKGGLQSNPPVSFRQF